MIRFSGKILFLLAFSSLSFPMAGQTIKGKVTDNDTHEPLMFCGVGVVGKNIGAITDKDGFFSLDISAIAENDSIVITYLGYEKITTFRKTLTTQTDPVFALKPQPHLLQTVVIKDEAEHIQVGNTSKNKFKGFNGWGGDENAGVGKQLGLLVDIDDEIVATRLLIHVEKNTYDSALMRLHIYSLNSEDYPGRELLISNVLFMIKKSSGWVEVDLRNYKIAVAQDFCVTIEWVKAWGASKGDLLTVSRAPNKPGISLYRGSFLGEWTKQEGELAPALALESIKIEPLTNKTSLSHRGQVKHAEAALSGKTSMKTPTAKASTLSSTSAYMSSGKSKAIGLVKTSKSTEGSSGLISESNEESGTLITGIDKDYSLVDFNFHLRFNTFDSLLFELKIYELDESKTPREILTSPIEFRIGKGEGWKKINLEAYKLVLKKDAVFTLRVIDAISLNNKPKDLYFSKSPGFGYRRDIKVGDWSVKSTMALSFYLHVRG